MPATSPDINATAFRERCADVFTALRDPLAATDPTFAVFRAVFARTALRDDCLVFCAVRATCALFALLADTAVRAARDVVARDVVARTAFSRFAPRSDTTRLVVAFDTVRAVRALVFLPSNSTTRASERLVTACDTPVQNTGQHTITARNNLNPRHFISYIKSATPFPRKTL